MDERIIDTVDADTLAIGDKIDAFLNGSSVEITNVEDTGNVIIVTLEDNTFAEEVVFSPNERVDIYGY